MGGRKWSLAAGIVLLAVLASKVRAEELLLLAQEPLPMAIRDGRVASITVRAVSFRVGKQELAPEVAAALERLAREAATDCFLTAQAVGHVRPGTPGDGDTLAAHRLARARAELVQATLARAGLPAASIAAVWDYGFTLREPRVTLWLFRLAEGEECRGTPLVAKAPQEPAPAKPVAQTAARPPAKAAPSSVRNAPAGSPVVTAEIRFDAGSSFLPRGAEQALRRLVEALPKDRAYRFELSAGIDDSQVRDGDPTQSARYNRWLSERRLVRVGDWLEQRAEIRDLEVSRALAERERSPRVLIRVLPSSGPAF